MAITRELYDSLLCPCLFTVFSFLPFFCKCLYFFLQFLSMNFNFDSLSSFLVSLSCFPSPPFVIIHLWVHTQSHLTITGRQCGIRSLILVMKRIIRLRKTHLNIFIHFYSLFEENYLYKSTSAHVPIPFTSSYSRLSLPFVYFSVQVKCALLSLFLSLSLSLSLSLLSLYYNTCCTFWDILLQSEMLAQIVTAGIRAPDPLICRHLHERVR